MYRYHYLSGLNDQQNEQTWSSGLCDCCGQDGNCCCFGCLCGFCFPWLGQAIILQDLKLTDNMCLPVLCYLVVGAFGNLPNCLISANLRYNIARKRGYKEDCCSSFFITCCCMPCSLAQIQRDYIKQNYDFKHDPNDCWGSFDPLYGYIGENIKSQTVIRQQPTLVNNMHN